MKENVLKRVNFKIEEKDNLFPRKYFRFLFVWKMSFLIFDNEILRGVM